MTASEGLTAMVQTLTAEVRTLAITLSMAKQLDEVPLEELTLIGRVRLGDDPQECYYRLNGVRVGRGTVIGRDALGNLCRSVFNSTLSGPSASVEIHRAASQSPLIVLAGCHDHTC